MELNRDDPLNLDIPLPRGRAFSDPMNSEVNHTNVSKVYFNLLISCCFIVYTDCLSPNYIDITVTFLCRTMRLPAN